MKNYFYLNPSRMLELTKGLNGSELKMLFAVMYCMAKTESTLFINNKENRQMMQETGFDRTPERICTLLSLLVKRGILKREANSLYSLTEGLFKLS